jgi:hypothetical protein
MCVMGLLEWHQNFWLKGTTVTEQFRVHGGVGDGSLDEDCFIFCTSLYGAMIVCISCLKIRHLFMKQPTSEKWLTSFASWRAFFRSLVVSWGPSTCQDIPRLLLHWPLSVVQIHTKLTQQHESQELLDYKTPPYLQKSISWNMKGCDSVPCFILLAGESPELLQAKAAANSMSEPWTTLEDNRYSVRTQHIIFSLYIALCFGLNNPTSGWYRLNFK